MNRLKLVKGAKYRVICDRASLCRPKGRLNFTANGQGCYASWTFESKRLAVGDVLEYVGSHDGIGSDPGIEESFKTADGLVGDLFPSGIWGGVSVTVLEPVA